MEELDAVVELVCHGDLPGRADGDASRPVKIPVVVSPKPELEVERAVWVEELDAVVEVVGHGDLPGRADGDASYPVKLPVAASPRSKLEVERAV